MLKNIFKPLLKFTALLFFCLFIFNMESCSVPAMTNPESYKRNNTVYALDFYPKNLSSLELYKMNEGSYESLGEMKNGQDAPFSIEINEQYLRVISNQDPMETPIYKTWINYARAELGYTESSPSVFETVEPGYIYQINLEEHPLSPKEKHRMLIYQ